MKKLFFLITFFVSYVSAASVTTCDISNGMAMSLDESGTPALITLEVDDRLSFTEEVVSSRPIQLVELRNGQMYFTDAIEYRTSTGLIVALYEDNNQIGGIIYGGFFLDQTRLDLENCSFM